MTTLTPSPTGVNFDREKTTNFTLLLSQDDRARSVQLEMCKPGQPASKSAVYYGQGTPYGSFQNAIDQAFEELGVPREAAPYPWTGHGERTDFEKISWDLRFLSDDGIQEKRFYTGSYQGIYPYHTPESYWCYEQIRADLGAALDGTGRLPSWVARKNQLAEVEQLAYEVGLEPDWWDVSEGHLWESPHEVARAYFSDSDLVNLCPEDAESGILWDESFLVTPATDADLLYYWWIYLQYPDVHQQILDYLATWAGCEPFLMPELTTV